jgi:hypothetical protein
LHEDDEEEHLQGQVEEELLELLELLLPQLELELDDLQDVRVQLLDAASAGSGGKGRGGGAAVDDELLAVVVVLLLPGANIFVGYAAITINPLYSFKTTRVGTDGSLPLLSLIIP